MTALYLHTQRHDSLDRARALVTALAPAAEVVSPHPAPLGWTGRWTRVADAEVPTWSDWLEERRPGSVIVEGPVDHVRAAVATGRPVAVVALPAGGTHGELGPAYGLADVILAPWAPGALGDSWPEAWLERTVHLGAVGHAARTALARHPLRQVLAEVRTGRGPWRCLNLAPTGAGASPRERREILAETPGWHWWFAGERELLSDGPVWGTLLRADVVVCSPTTPNLAAVAAARVPAVLILPDRPAAEQTFLAEIARRTAPVVVAGQPALAGQWHDLLGLTRELDGERWSTWEPGDLRAALAARGFEDDPGPRAEPVDRGHRRGRVQQGARQVGSHGVGAEVDQDPEAPATQLEEGTAGGGGAEGGIRQLGTGTAQGNQLLVMPQQPGVPPGGGLGPVEPTA